jgi:LysM repeat protein
MRRIFSGAGKYAVLIIIGIVILLVLLSTFIFKPPVPPIPTSSIFPPTAAVVTSTSTALIPITSNTLTSTPSLTTTLTQQTFGMMFCVNSLSRSPILVRYGPGTNYPPLSEPLSEGQCLAFSGRTRDGVWVQIAPIQPDPALQRYAGRWISQGEIAVLVDHGNSPRDLPVVILIQTPKSHLTETMSIEETPTRSASSVACTPEYSFPIYLVRSGDTLSSIALATNSTVEELMRANCIPPGNANTMYAGQPLYVPRLPIRRPTATSALITLTATPNAIQTLQAAFNEVDRQFQESIRANIAYNVPKTMKLEETITIELLLKPSMYQEELATQLVEGNNFLTSTAEAGQLATQIVVGRGFLTSTAEPGQPVTEHGEEVAVVTGDVIITPRMKAVLRSLKPGAFEIQELHDSAEQPISSMDTTKWRWSVTAKELGEQSLEIEISRLIEQDNNEYWREVEAYRADINVQVTSSQWIKSLDWKWIIGILVTALLIPLFFRWYDRRKKEIDEHKQPKPSKQKRRTK